MSAISYEAFAIPLAPADLDPSLAAQWATWQLFFCMTAVSCMAAVSCVCVAIPLAPAELGPSLNDASHACCLAACNDQRLHRRVCVAASAACIRQNHPARKARSWIVHGTFHRKPPHCEESAKYAVKQLAIAWIARLARQDRLDCQISDSTVWNYSRAMPPYSVICSVVRLRHPVELSLCCGDKHVGVGACVTPVSFACQSVKTHFMVGRVLRLPFAQPSITASYGAKDHCPTPLLYFSDLLSRM